MYLGKVVGCVWSTAKNKDLEGQRLLIVQPLTPELANTGKRIICADSTGAGAGEIIYWVRGKESSFPFLPTEVPVDTTIVGIVDEVHVNRNRRTEAAAEPAAAAPPLSPAAPTLSAPAAPQPKAAKRGRR